MRAWYIYVVVERHDINIVFISVKYQVLRFDFASFMSNVSHEQVCDFISFEIFKEMILIYLIMYFQYPQFENIYLKRLNLEGNALLVTECTQIMIHSSQVFNSFADTFFLHVHKLVTMFIQK